MDITEHKREVEEQMNSARRDGVLNLYELVDKWDRIVDTYSNACTQSDASGYWMCFEQLLDALTDVSEQITAELDALKESQHHAEGVADLAMKHRDAAESECDALRKSIEDAPVWIIPNAKPASESDWRIVIESVCNLNALRGKHVRLFVEDEE